MASAHNTWHIEALRVVYYPSRVTYAALVNQALRTSDPTDGGGVLRPRQPVSPGDLRGQLRRAQGGRSRERPHRTTLGKPIATDIPPRGRFYPAES
ncbi:MAG: hypothetical protein WKF52_08220 [Sphingomicrobium sp.]